MDLSDPSAAAILCVQALEAGGLACAVCGGLALAAYGVPRETRDVDVAVADVTAAAASSALSAAGLDVVVAFDDVRFGGLRVGRVTLLGGTRHTPSPTTGLNVLDLVRPRSPRYAVAVLARAVEGSLRGARIRLVSPEDFVLLKLLASRDRDLEDAAGVLGTAADVLDLGVVEDEVARLASELPDWDVRGRWLKVRRAATP